MITEKIIDIITDHIAVPTRPHLNRQKIRWLYQEVEALLVIAHTTQLLSNTYIVLERLPTSNNDDSDDHDFFLIS